MGWDVGRGHMEGVCPPQKWERFEARINFDFYAKMEYFGVF